jgi:hypothetical protein
MTLLSIVNKTGLILKSIKIGKYFLASGITACKIKVFINYNFNTYFKSNMFTKNKYKL